MVIFINLSRLTLSNDKTQLDSPEYTLKVSYLGKIKSLHQYIDLLEKSPEYKTVVIYYSDLQKLIADFTSIYKIIEAAGGLVFNEKKEILVMFRRGLWDLPKGKIDEGETPEIASVREVIEETGLVNVVIERFFKKTYHTYTLKEKRILKRTYWYLMQTTDTKLTPQTEEDIEIVQFVEKHRFLVMHKQIYGSILELLTAVEQ